MTTTNTMTRMVLDRWHSAVKSYDDLLNALSDEQVQKEIAPGKNRGIYLLGHLVAAHESMLVLLDMGDKQHPELEEPYLKQPDKAVTLTQTVAELRDYWSRQRDMIKQKFDQLKPEDWFEKHTAVSAEDFAKEPHRNKLNVVLTRTTHLTNHTGQMVLLK